MQIEWFVVGILAFGSPDRAERAILGVILAGRCFGQLRLYLWHDFTQGHLMKVKWFVANIPAVGSLT